MAAGGSRLTVWANDVTDGPNTLIAAGAAPAALNAAGAPVTYTDRARKTTSMRIGSLREGDNNTDRVFGRGTTPSSDHVYYGYWAERTASVGGAETPGATGHVYGGSMPHGVNPDASGEATFNGIALLNRRLGNAAGTDNGAWGHVGGTVRLRADFSKDMIGGEISFARGTDVATTTDVQVAPGTTLAARAARRTGLDDIILGDAPIGSTGSFAGTARFETAGTTNQSGSWEGGFFGDPIAVEAGVESSADPTHAAGGFNVLRDRTASQRRLEIYGAFGACAGASCAADD